MSESKVRVTKLFGGGGATGMMDPKVGMTTDKGTIVAMDSGNYQVSVSGNGVSTLTKFYPHQLFVADAHATGVHAYPTGDGSVVFGRNTLWANGVPDAVGTGISFMEGDGTPFTFGR